MNLTCQTRAYNMNNLRIHCEHALLLDWRSNRSDLLDVLRLSAYVSGEMRAIEGYGDHD